MNGEYKIFNSSDELILSFSDLIECYDYTGRGERCSYSFIGINEKKINISRDIPYYLQSDLFEGRLDFYFNINEFQLVNNGLLLNMNVSSGMYKFGALSILDFYLNSKDRIWLDMKGIAKKNYISASYLKNGFQKKIKNNDIIFHGKYIHDYYSFYCELGYSIFGSYGYVGNNLNALYDILNDTIEKKRDLIWKDSELSFKAIDNSMPADYSQASSEDMLSLLDDFFNIIYE
ncbi:barstar family protein [Providencia sp. Me31A]|uniref:barstar family protein n=1 Tax=Providencia sp. Me31A TaxID=3392637 RepID=UPI003D272FE8